MSQITLTDKQLATLLSQAKQKRWLNKKEAAQYVGVSPRTFVTRVAEGIIHKASKHLGYTSPRWDVQKLDEEMLSGFKAV